MAGTDALMKIVSETLAELGEDVVHIRLDKIRIPFYGCAVKSEDSALSAVHDAIYEIMSATGVVFITPSVMGGVSALMKAFLEHFAVSQFSQGLMDKNCMVVTSGASTGSGTRETLEYLSRIIALLGGYDAIRVNIPYTLLQNGAGDEVRQAVEKQTEDFYRILRQNRRFYPLDGPAARAPEPEAPAAPDIDNEENLRTLRERVGNRILTPEQEEDVSVIARLLSERLDHPSAQATVVPVRPRNKTCRQLTASMPHYYNPQLAAGLRMTVGISITGDETFSGVILVDASHCSFEEGSVPADAEIAITADSKAWTDVLTGKHTAQKAFMTGQIKVRGNFLLLTKLDQLFSKMDA